ncbi:chymotrypsin-2-like [Uranotaenia lowii]|uniref:chymotrypsin-2-like n=1 Tax=Uranotaenia lowii TaxID=190385 RepID=UPI002479178B|nr:chymotrypsin-2-like [Uranotaenia lowii]
MLKFGALLMICLAVAKASPVLLGQDAEPESRMAGGQDAPEGDFPYQVSLRLGGIHYCGGAILNQRWIITAASCASGVAPSALEIVAGTYSLSNGGTSHTADRIVIHPNFEIESLTNDVAVVRVRQPFIISSSVLALQMGRDRMSISYGAIVSGWGRAGMDSPAISDRLQYHATNIITNTECQARMESPYYERINDSVMCTSNPEGVGICLGNAGGPLVFGGELVGVVSWSIPCGLGLPDVYSRISVHRGWALVHTMLP